MLLFVVGAEQDDGERRRVGRGQEREHPLVDARPPRAHLVERGTREQPPRGPRMTRPGRLVVRVEEQAPSLVVPAMRRIEARENELLEEPGRVGQVPLRRARVGHRLHEHVLGRQRRREGLGPSARTCWYRRIRASRSTADLCGGSAAKQDPRCTARRLSARLVDGHSTDATVGSHGGAGHDAARAGSVADLDGARRAATPITCSSSGPGSPASAWRFA